MVTVSFRLPASKRTLLVLPSEWQGQQEIYKAIGDLEALSPGTFVQEGETPWSRAVTFPMGRASAWASRERWPSLNRIVVRGHDSSIQRDDGRCNFKNADASNRDLFRSPS
jgi:hypothetical protein